MSAVARSFGRRLASLRKLQGITQARLAELLSVTPEYVSNLERGSSTPSFELIGRLADVLRTEIANLFLFAPDTDGGSADTESPGPSPSWTRYLTGVGSWAYDVRRDDFWWSLSMYRLLGLRSGEDMPTLERYRNMVHPQDRPRVEREQQRLFESGDRSGSEFRIIRADGETRSVVSYTEVERNAEGNVVRATGELVDVTEQKRLERSLRDLRQALEERVREDTNSLGRTVSDLNAVILEKEATLRRLEESQARFRSLVENMNEVFWINDRTTNKLLYMTPSFERIFGQSVEVLRNDVRNFINLVHPDDRESALEAFRQARGRGDEYQDFYRTITPSGEVRWIHSRGRPFHDDPRLFAGMAEDVTNLKSAEAELERLRRVAGTEAQAHQKLLASLSHEVRNPALALSRILDLISREDDPQRRRELIACAQFAEEQVVTISESILRVAKLKEEYPHRRSEVFSLTTLLQRLGGVFAAQTSGRDVTVSVGVNPEIPEHIEGDASALRQILFNLLGNALKFTTHGSVRLTVEEGVRVPDDDAFTLRFVVEDTGQGIPKERQEEIFAWMRRGADDGTLGTPGESGSGSAGEAGAGLGIGLSVVRSLVELLDGEIRVASSPGVGTAFTVSLPFKAVDQKEYETTVTEADSPEGCALSVLLVEDEDISALAATAALKDAGCEVLRISDAVELTEELRRRSYDLVILDVNLRGIHAAEVLDGLAKALPAEQWPPILVVSAHTDEEEERRLRALGVDGYVDKRYEWGSLSRAIGGAVSHYQRKKPDRPVSR